MKDQLPGDVTLCLALNTGVMVDLGSEMHRLESQSLPLRASPGSDFDNLLLKIFFLLLLTPESWTCPKGVKGIREEVSSSYD